MGWSAFLHSIQLDENLAPTKGFAGAVKMATLKLHLNSGQSPKGQQFVFRKTEKKKKKKEYRWSNAQSTLGYVAWGPPLRCPGLGLQAVLSSQRPWAQCQFWLGM